MSTIHYTPVPGIFKRRSVMYRINVKGQFGFFWTILRSVLYALDTTVHTWVKSSSKGVKNIFSGWNVAFLSLQSSMCCSVIVLIRRRVVGCIEETWKKFQSFFEIFMLYVAAPHKLKITQFGTTKVPGNYPNDQTRDFDRHFYYYRIMACQMQPIQPALRADIPSKSTVCSDNFSTKVQNYLGNQILPRSTVTLI